MGWRRGKKKVSNRGWIKEIQEFVTFGYSVRDYESMTLSQRSAILEEIMTEKKRQRILNKLDLAEVINAAYFGIQADKHNRNAGGYKRWRKELIKDLEETYQIKRPTIWQIVKKRRK